jgi:hypothetical protein
MTATTMPLLPPRASTCIGCGKTFIPPTLASLRGGSEVVCRACAKAGRAAAVRAEIDAYNAICTTGTISQ